ncbi:MAG: leucine-rich repeat domain-containing protein [Clostridiales bacterium]|jgi:Leucine-rich repeat (LRR) protein|nr:leucine-rich repeat domain-containing protein [Clostridiales bacterium]
MKTKSKILSSLILICMVAALAVAVCFAAFTTSGLYDAEITSGGMNISADYLSVSGDETFDVIGDRYERTFTVENLSDYAVSYTVAVTIEDRYADFIDSILFYIDGQYVGVMGELFRGGEINPLNSYESTVRFAMPNPLLGSQYGAKATATHTLGYEYHLGQLRMPDTRAITVSAAVETVQAKNNSEYLLVDNETQFRQVFHDLNKIAAQNDPAQIKKRTIILTDDITLSAMQQSEMTLRHPASIELYGSTLDLGTVGAIRKRLIFDFSGVSDFVGDEVFADMGVKDCRGGGSVKNGDIEIDTLRGYYTFAHAAEGANLTFIPTNSDFSAVADRVRQNIADWARFGLYADGEAFLAIQDLRLYTSVYGVTSSNACITADPSGYLTVNQSPATAVSEVRVTFSGYSRAASVKVWGANDYSGVNLSVQAIFDTLTTEGSGSSLVYKVDRDMYFLTAFKSMEAVLEWHISAPGLGILTRDGKFTKPIVDADFSVTAKTVVNGKTYALSYNLRGIGMTGAERLREIIAKNQSRFSFVTLNTPVALMSVNDVFPGDTESYYEKYRVTSLRYTLDTDVAEHYELNAANPTTGGGDIALMETYDYEDNRVAIHVAAQFLDRGAETADIVANVNVQASSNIFDIIHVYLTDYIRQLTAGENIIRGFMLPNYYPSLNNPIKYTIRAGGPHVLNGPNIPAPEEYTNRDDAVSGNYARIENNPDVPTSSLPYADFIVTPYNLPNVNSVLNIEYTIRHEGQELTRFLPVNLAGMIRNDDTGFPDTNLYYYIRSKLDANGDFYLTVDEIEDDAQIRAAFTNNYVIALNNSYGITSIHGLERIKGLKSLSFQNNDITDLSPLTHMYTLTSIDFSNTSGTAKVRNRIQDIRPLSGLTALTSVNLRYNDITEVDSLRYLYNLTTLYINHNARLTDITALEELPLLSTLYAYNIAGGNIKDEFRYTYVRLYNKIGSSARIFFESDSTYVNFASFPNFVKAGNILSGMFQPVKEAYDVISLPATTYYLGELYRIKWQEPTSTGIIQFDYSRGRAYIVRPIGDTKVMLTAMIDTGYANGISGISRAFNVAMIGSRRYIQVVARDTQVYAAHDLIPDLNLLDALLQQYGTSSNDPNVIDTIDINAILATPGGAENSPLYPEGGILNLNAKHIKYLEGIQYFSGLFTVLHLMDNDIQPLPGEYENLDEDARALEPLRDLVGITEFKINNGAHNFEVISDTNPNFSALKYVYVYGCEANDTEAAIFYLFTLYERAARQGTTIDVNYDDKVTFWDPYVIFLRRAVYNFDSIYVLEYLGSVFIPKEIEVLMYDGTTRTVTVTRPTLLGTTNVDTATHYGYTRTGNNYLLYGADYNTTANIQCTLLGKLMYRMTNVLYAMPRNVLVEYYAGSDLTVSVGNLFNLAKNRQIIGAFLPMIHNKAQEVGGAYGGNWLITRTQINAVASLVLLDGGGLDDGGVQKMGFEILKRATALATIQINYLRAASASDIAYARAIFTDTYFPALRRLLFSDVAGNTAHIDMRMFESLTLLNEIQITYAAELVVDYWDGGTRVSCFRNMTQLTSLSITNCTYLTDYWFLTDLPASTLIITLYGNSADRLSNETNYYIQQAYDKLPSAAQANFKLSLDVNVFWQPTPERVVNNELLFYRDPADLQSFFYMEPFKSSINNLETLTGITSGNYTFYLPKLLDGKYNLTWSAEFGSASISIVSFDANFYLATVTRHTAHAYLVLKVTTPDDAPNNKAALDLYRYCIFVRGSGTAGSGIVNLEDFMSDTVTGKFASPYFLYKVVEALYYVNGDPDNDGVFTTAFATLLTTLNINTDYNLRNTNVPTSTSTVQDTFNNVVVNDIRGIKYFTGLTSLSLVYQPIVDGSELRYLTNMQTLNLESSAIRHLYYLDTDGVTKISIFYHMQNLKTINLNYCAISDYSYIVSRVSPATDLPKLLNLYIYTRYRMSTGNSFQPIESQNYHSTILTWASYMTSTDSYVVYYKGSGNLTGRKTVMDGYMDAIRALEDLTVADVIYTDAPSSDPKLKLPKRVTVMGAEYDIAWAFDSHTSVTAPLLSLDGDKVIIGIDSNYANGRVRMGLKGTVTYNSRAISVVYDTQFTTLSNESKNYQVEVTAGEYLYYMGANPTGSAPYYVPAEVAIPDSVMRAYLFSSTTFNVNNTDEILSASDRSRSITSVVTIQNSNIHSIQGIELFYGMRGLTLAYLSITRIPNLRIRSGSPYTSFNIQYCTLLNDFSGLDYTATPNALDIQDGIQFTSFNRAFTSTVMNYLILNREDLRYTYRQGSRLTGYTINYSGVNDMSFLNDPNFFVGPPVKMCDAMTTISIGYLYGRHHAEQVYRMIFDRASTAVQSAWTLSPSKLNKTSYIVSTAMGYIVQNQLDMPVDEFAIGTQYTLPGTVTKWGETYSVRYGTHASYTSYYSLTTATTQRITISKADPNKRVIVTVSLSDSTNTLKYVEQVYLNVTVPVDLTTVVPNVNYTDYELEVSPDVFVPLASVVPDVVMRMLYVNTIYAGQPPEDRTENKIYRRNFIDRLNLSLPSYLNSIEGIQYFTGLTSLTFPSPYGFLGKDLSPLAALTNLTTLTINYFYTNNPTGATYHYAMPDMSFLEYMPNLTTITLDFMHSQYNILYQNDKIATIYNVRQYANASTIDAGYIRNAWAYAHATASALLPNMPTDNSTVGTVPYASTKEELEAALILDRIAVNNYRPGSRTDLVFTFTGSVSTGNVLPASVIGLDDVEYEITWKAYSPNLTVTDKNILTIRRDYLLGYGMLVASIQKNGGQYERLFMIPLDKLT